VRATILSSTWREYSSENNAYVLQQLGSRLALAALGMALRAPIVRAMQFGPTRIQKVSRNWYPFLQDVVVVVDVVR